MYAGQNEFYRWGGKMIDNLKICLKPNKNGFYTIETKNGKYWEFGTSKSKYGEFIRIEDTIFSVDRLGFAWAKVGTEKADKFVYYIKKFINLCLIKHYGKGKHNYNEIIEHEWIDVEEMLSGLASLFKDKEFSKGWAKEDELG